MPQEYSHKVRFDNLRTPDPETGPMVDCTLYYGTANPLEVFYMLEPPPYPETCIIKSPPDGFPVNMDLIHNFRVYIHDTYVNWTEDHIP